MPTILRNDEAAFGIDAWKEEDFVRCMRQRNCIAKRAEHNGLIIGHMVYELHVRRLSLLNICVHPDYQRRYVGMAMIANLLKSMNKRPAITMLVNETNMPALLFFRAMGFKATGLVRDAFPNCQEDGIAMELRVGAAVRIAG